GYSHVIHVHMTGKVVPSHLIFVRLHIQIEGVDHERIFESDRMLRYVFAWEPKNVYKQTVFGIVDAVVLIGYEYRNCGRIFWEKRTVRMSGSEMSSSGMGLFNLHMHHAYNYRDGILHKGDGSIMYLKGLLYQLNTVVGTGKTRRPDCNDCSGDVHNAKLFAPVSLASARDGSLVIGDYNFIRLFNANRDAINNILQLDPQEFSHKYHMTISPVDGLLYVSDAINLKVIRVKHMARSDHLKDNFEYVVGTGEQCYPGDADNCGDGKLAKYAKLSYPKGLAIDRDNILYIADGAFVRYVDTLNKIHTLIGSNKFPELWSPFPCSGALPVDKVKLQWPTELSINPLDNSLHILDNNLVFKLTHNNQVSFDNDDDDINE
ncbi:hypothetical protein HELRODRAFT_81946, partial [Helobdella robusta]|uniref:Uncharacterized protein n=1 Tax=Helobdella robusta TaxID=6412 RepID=T1G4K8_HELRO